MTSRLAVRLKEEDSATVAQSSLAELGTYVDACTQMDGEELGEYIERNWDNAVGNALGLMFLVKEMKRRFKLLDRKKQVNGEYKTIRGFTSFDKWFTSFTKKSRRLAYYLLETEEKKNERNAERRDSEKKKDKVVSLYREGEVIEHDGRRYVVTNVTIHEDTDEKSSFIVEVKPYSEPEPPSPEDKKAKRSAAAKKAMATRAANKAAAQPAAAPATALGECESCCDGTLATEVVGVSAFNSDGYKYCAKCADDNRKYDRKHLIRQMGVQKVMGKFHTIKSLVELGGKVGGDGSDGEEPWRMPTVRDYLARVKEKFLGNPRYDQTVVGEYIARLEKKMEATQ